MKDSPSGEPRPPRNGEPGFFPDHAADWRADYEQLTVAERVAQAIRLSETLTRLAESAPRR